MIASTIIAASALIIHHHYRRSVQSEEDNSGHKETWHILLVIYLLLILICLSFADLKFDHIWPFKKLNKVNGIPEQFISLNGNTLSMNWTTINGYSGINAGNVNWTTVPGSSYDYRYEEHHHRPTYYTTHIGK